MSLTRLQIPFLTTAQRAAIIINDKDLVLDTDLNQLWVGDGVTLGGILANAGGGYIHPNHSGEVTSVADGATTIANDAVTNSKLANMATKTYKGRTTAATGDPEDIAVATLKTDLGLDGAVIGPASTVADTIVVFDGTTGKLIESSYLEIADLIQISQYEANSILYATDDDSPQALIIAASTIVGRKSTGSIVALTAAETKTILALVKADVGLGSVDNTADTAKPVSTAQQTALDLKANDADVVHDAGTETIAGVKTFSSDPLIPDEVYGVGWNGVLEPPTKNALYDKIETLGGGGDVIGPASAGNNDIVAFNGTTGKLIKVSGYNISVLDAMYAITTTAIVKTDYDANTILYATTDNLPEPLTIGASTIVGRKATGNIVALTATEATEIMAAASLTVAGKVELATTAEINTGTDTIRAIPVDQYVASNRNVRFIDMLVVEKATDCATGTNLIGAFEVPFTGIITEIGAYVEVAGTTNASIFDVNYNGSTIMTTNKLSIDSAEVSTRTAGTAPTLTTTAVTAGGLLTIDCDSLSTTKPKGLHVRIGIRMT